jgi:MFS family permease
MFGACTAGTLGDKLGRRTTIMISDIFMFGGALILSISFGPVTLSFGRLLVGAGLGISMMISPVYLSESSPISIRGQIVPSYFL